MRLNRIPIVLQTYLRTAAVSLSLLVSGLSQFSFSTDPSKSEWSQFRGPNGNGKGSALHEGFDLALDKATWKRELTKGTSSPIISNGKLFVTSFEGTQRVITAFNPVDGELLWDYAIPSLRKETATPPNGPATCTPACADNYVAAFFPDAGLVVCDTNGKLVWQKDIGPFFSMHGISASPIIVDSRLIITVDQLSDSYIVAFDLRNGDQLWKVDRVMGITGGYATPAVIELGERKLIVSPSPSEMLIYDAATGEQVSSIAGLTNAPVTVPAVFGNRFCYSEPPGEPMRMDALGPADKNNDGFIELSEVERSVGMKRLIERIDQGFGNSDGKIDGAEFEKAFNTFLNRGGLSCVELTDKAGTIEPNVIWKYTKATPYIASALMVDDLVYIINDGGIMICFDASNGEVVKRERLSAATGTYYASPIAAGDKIVAANLDGKLTLLQTGREFSVLKTVDFGEPIVATPSVAQGKLFVRTDTALYCF